jgi:hypothetical protein
VNCAPVEYRKTQFCPNLNSSCRSELNSHHHPMNVPLGDDNEAGWGPDLMLTTACSDFGSFF